MEKPRLRSKCLLSIVIALIILSACKPSVPKWALSESELEEVLYDYCLATSAAENVVLSNGEDREQLRYQYVQKVFEKHRISEADFDSTMVWYSSDAKRLKSIFSKINARLDQEAKGLGVDLSETEMYANYSLDGDTANIWNGSKILFMSNAAPNNVRTISLPVGDGISPGDKFKLSFYSDFLPSGVYGSAYVLFNVRYADNSNQAQVRYIAGNYKTEINLEPNARQDTIMPTQIQITLYTNPAGATIQKSLLYLTYPSVLRIHKEKVEVQEIVPDTTEEARDSLAVDSLAQERPDTMTSKKRLSPLEERDLREVKHEFDIVKERVIRPSSNRRPQRRRVSQ